MRKGQTTPWGELTPVERAEAEDALSQKLVDVLANPPKRAVWETRTSGPRVLYDDPEDVGRRFLWDAIRRHGGEPSGWGVELLRKGIQRTGGSSLAQDALWCRAPDGNLVEPGNVLGYHFRMGHTFKVGEGHFAIEAAKRRQAEERVTAARRRVEEDNRRDELHLRAERDEARRALIREVAREVADGLVADALADIDAALDDL